MCLGKGKKDWHKQKGCWALQKILGKKLFYDISSPLTPTFGAKKHWLLVLEDSTHYAWSYLLKEKCEMKNVILGLIKNLKTKNGLQVWYAWCDNAGENEDFEWICKQAEMGVEFKYTTPDTPQQNDWVKWKLATFFNRVCTMLNCGKFPFSLRNSVWGHLHSHPSGK